MARRRGDASLPNHEAVVDWCDVSYWHPDSLRGKVAIVTGAARGVGKGVSAALLERGASVLLVDVAADQLSSTTSEFAEQATQRLNWPPTCGTRMSHN